MKKKFTHINISYIITLVLVILWICVKIIKSIMNRDGITRYNFIQNNTVAYWLAISLSFSISKYLFKSYLYFFVILVAIIIIHEILWYKLYIGFTKDEWEVTNNFYNWFNIYCDKIKSNNITDTDNENNKSDISEGLFNNNWNLTDKESYQLKFDTYFEYLKLKPGMKILDIGCGNVHWLQYCKSKGVDGVGITISESQYEYNTKNGLKIILGDIHKDILTTIKTKFDAISAIGPVEHFCSVSQPMSKNIIIIEKYYNQVKKLIDPNSESRRYLNSYMTTNHKYSKHKNFNWYCNVYIIASAFGYGCYLRENDIDKIYSSKNSKLLIKEDYTEDYRWGGVRDKNSWAYCNYKFDTPYHIANFVKDVFIDPSWWQRFLYGYFNCWLWQFGGTKRVPMPENKDTPIRSYIYVTVIN